MNLVSGGKWLLGNHSRSCLVWSFLSYMDTCLIYVYFEVLGYVCTVLYMITVTYPVLLATTMIYFSAPSSWNSVITTAT